MDTIEKKYRLFELSWKGTVKACSNLDMTFDTHEEALAELTSKDVFGNDVYSYGQYVVLEVYLKGRA